MKCDITGKECEFAEDDGSGGVECLAVFQEQCPIRKGEME